jgi:hypothetical protein
VNWSPDLSQVQFLVGPFTHVIEMVTLFDSKGFLNMAEYLRLENRSFSWPWPPLRFVAKSTKSAHVHWVVGIYENHFVTTSPFRNGSHLPTTQCTCADFVDFATQRNGGRVKDLYHRAYKLLTLSCLY